jgi:hypothetical protein
MLPSARQLIANGFDEIGRLTLCKNRPALLAEPAALVDFCANT